MHIGVVSTIGGHAWIVSNWRRRHHRVTLVDPTCDGPPGVAGLDAVVAFEPTMAAEADRISSAAGLPPTVDGAPLDRADQYRRWSARGLAVPAWRLMDSADSTRLPLPCVVKPVSVLDPRPSRLCHRTSEVEAAWGALSAPTTGDRCAIAQEYVAPTDLDGFGPADFRAVFAVGSGRPVLLGLSARTRKLYRDGRVIDRLTVLPPRQTWDDILGTPVSRLAGYVAEAGPPWGVCHLEFGIRDRRVVGFEVKPGLVPAFEAVMLERAYGVDLAATLLSVAKRHRPSQLPRQLTDFPLAILSIGGDGAAARGDVYGGLDLDASGMFWDRFLGSESVLLAGDPLAGGPADAPVARLAYSYEPGLTRWLSAPARVRVIRAEGPPGDAGHGTLRTSACHSIDEVPDWDRLARDYSLYSSAGWLRAVEGMPGSSDRTYLTVRDAATGRLVGGLACWLQGDSIARSHDPAVLTSLPGSHPPDRTRPVLLVGSLSGYAAEWLVDQSLPDAGQRTVGEHLHRALTALAHRLGAGTTWLLYATTRAVDRVRPYAETVVPVQPETEIPLGPGTFEDWMSRLPKRVAENVRRAARAPSPPVDVAHLDRSVDDIAPILSAHNSRFGMKYSADDMRRYLALQRDAMNDDTVVFRFRTAGVTTAYSCCVRWGDTLYVRTYGADPGADPKQRAYFRAVVVEPVRYALAQSLRRLSLGPGSYPAKFHHGAVPVARSAVLLRRPGGPEQP